MSEFEETARVVREVAERLSIEGQLAAPILSEEGRLRAKMSDCARDLFKAGRAFETRKRELEAEVLRVVDALEFAHNTGFEWPSDPLPFGSIAHNLFIERGNDPERIASRAAIGNKP